MQDMIVFIIVAVGAFFVFRYLKKSFQAKDCCSCDVKKAKDCASAWCPLKSAVPSGIPGEEVRTERRMLSDLKPGESGTITKLSGESTMYHRLLEMGVTRGSFVEVVRLAPLGDPMDVRILGYHLLLRKNEARTIEVAVRKPAVKEQGA